MAAVRARRTGGSAKGATPPPYQPIPKLAAAPLSRRRAVQEDAPPRRPMSTGGALIAGAVLFAGLATAGAALMGGELYDLREGAFSTIDRTLASSGLAVDSLRLGALDPYRQQAVERLVLPPNRRSMFAADPQDVKARVESLDWVESASVQRLWPSTIRVDIVKRRAIARWQENGTVSLIDAAGERVHDVRGADAGDLPLVVGLGAGPAAEPVLRALEALPEVRGRLRALIRVGDRRWDARLSGGLTVALPEARPELALAALERMHAQDRLLDRAIARIDMRQPALIVVTPYGAPADGPADITTPNVGRSIASSGAAAQGA